MALTVDILRQLVSDTAETPILQDEAYEVQILLGETNAYRAAAVLCRQLSAQFASKVDVKAGPVSVSNSDKAKAYADLATKYDALALRGLGEDPENLVESEGFMGVILTGVSISEMASVKEDTDRVTSVFEKGLDKNWDSTEE